MLTLHRKYNGVAKEPVFYVADNGKAKEVKGAKARSWLAKLGKKVRLLSTSAHSSDATLLQLAEQGVTIFTAHWHNTGIDKGMEPKEIALAFSRLEDSVLRPYVPRPDLSRLRGLVTVRNAVLEYRKGAASQIGSAIRSLGVSIDRLPSFVALEQEELDADSSPIEAKCARELTAEAKKIQECKTFNRVFGMKNGWIVAAQFVSAIGDISRFPNVAAFWHYLGQHVVNGKAPKRARGAANDWNPGARCTLWKTIDAGLKNNVPLIRAMYEDYKAEELAAHDVKCPNCETKVGHCGARARRRVTKELLKQYYVAAGGTGKKMPASAFLVAA
jgi:hypothetical protein